MATKAVVTKPVATKSTTPIKTTPVVSSSIAKGTKFVPGVTSQGKVPVKSPSTGYTAPDPFAFNYNYLNFDTAKGQAEQQFNPLFEQAVNGVKAQQYQNTLDSGQSSAVRGLAHSGLAQDALTKIAIASQGQISGLEAQKMSDVARTANELLARDQARGDSLRSQMFNEYQSNRDFGYNQNRDSIGDARYADETKYNRGRDTLADTRYADETKYNRGQDALNRHDSNYWNKVNQNNITRDFNRNTLVQDREWNQMSPAEKMRMSMELANSLKLKKASGGTRGGKDRKSTSTKSKATPAQRNAEKQFDKGEIQTGKPQNYSQYVSKMYHDFDKVDAYKADMERINRQRKAAGLPPIQIKSPEYDRGYEY